MPPEMRNRILTAYENIRQLEPQENPVKKVLFVVSGAESEVHIDEIADMGELDGGNNGAQVVEETHVLLRAKRLEPT